MCGIIGFEKRESTREQALRAFAATKSWGPDMTRFEEVGGGALGFHRLAIMGLQAEGMQPFHLGGDALVCNGEIYGFRPIRAQLSEKYQFFSQSDCEVLLPMYEKYGVGMFEKLDAEFACILYDGKQKKFIVARDPIGIRPLYYGYDGNGTILFASEPKNLVGLVGKILPFPPGHYYKDGEFHSYNDIADPKVIVDEEIETITKKIKDKLEAAVIKRLHSDAPIGFLLSGGLDSSLVA